MRKPKRPIDFDDTNEVEQRVREAVKQAVEHNKKIGNALPEQNGEEIRLVPAEDLPDSKS